MKKTLLILTLALLTAVSAKGQIFLQEDESGDRALTDPGLYVDLPDGYGYGMDFYVPTGCGIIIFTALGGAYLLKKKKENKQ